MSSLIFAPKIAANLSDAAAAVFKDNIVVLREVDSTNHYARRMVEKGCNDGTIVVAETQTAGRGRTGRDFFSPIGTGLYFSLICNDARGLPHFDKPAYFTVSAALAVRRALKEVCGIDAGIKWPNDVFCNGKKICGILAEGLQGQNRLATVILGIGINVSTMDFPNELKSIAASLPNGENIDRNVLLAKILNELFVLLARDFKSDILTEYREASILTGKKVAIWDQRKNFSATVAGIDSDYRLVVRDESGQEKRLVFGDVHILLE